MRAFLRRLRRGSGGLHARRGHRVRRDPRHHHGAARHRDGRGVPHRLRNSGAARQRGRRPDALHLLPVRTSQSVDADGVNPATVDDEGDLQDERRRAVAHHVPVGRGPRQRRSDRRAVPRVGSGPDSQIVRRICRGADPMVEIVVAKHFGEAGTTPAADYLVEGRRPDAGLLPAVLHTEHRRRVQVQPRRATSRRGRRRQPAAPGRARPT